MIDHLTAISLSGVQRELAASGKLKELENYIRRALVAQSCQGDLQEAAECVQEIHKFYQAEYRHGSKTPVRAEAALFYMAISLYARATITNAKRGERGPIQIQDHLGPQQLIDHQAIIDVRNKYQAHVYQNELINDVIWLRSEVLLLHGQGRWLPMATTHTTLSDPHMLARLERQIPVALSIVGTRTADNLGKIAEALKKHWSPELLSMLAMHGVDPVAVFGSEEAAKRAIDGMGGAPFMWHNP